MHSRRQNVDSSIDVAMLGWYQAICSQRNRSFLFSGIEIFTPGTSHTGAPTVEAQKDDVCLGVELPRSPTEPSSIHFGCNPPRDTLTGALSSPHQPNTNPQRSSRALLITIAFATVSCLVGRSCSARFKSRQPILYLLGKPVTHAQAALVICARPYCRTKSIFETRQGGN